MSNGEHTLALVRAENARVIEDMQRRLETGQCGDPSACISGFSRILSLIEMLFELHYDKKPHDSRMYVPKSFREAFLIAATKSPWAVATITGVIVIYAMYANKALPFIGI